MNRPLYSVRDNVACSFGAPFVDVNDQTATRGFAFALKQNKLQAENPADFDLFKVGEFDDDAGVVKVIDKVLVFAGSSLKVGEK